jgi:uncharacterized protein YcfJ
MKRTLQAVMAAAALCAAGHAAAQITLYEGDGFRGRAITVNERMGNLARANFNDRASSIIVDRGRWEVCEHARFEGRCVLLRRGSYPSLRAVGLENAISSVRPVEGRGRQAAPEPVAVPLPPPAQPQWRVRQGEETYEVPVAQVRGMAGTPSQRCWTERQQVAQPSGNEPNVGGALIGGLVGGILGHQVGGGTGKDLATVGGAVGGAVVGSNIANNNSGSRVTSRDVQRCENVGNAQPEYYDVVYFHNNVEHHVQMKYPPGPTIRVNMRGEPRL